jgi:YD repeat-containing protein
MQAVESCRPKQEKMNTDPVSDRRNREIQSNWSDSTPDITRSFDAAGRVLSEDNGRVKLTYTYNPANEVLSETTHLNGQPARTVGYGYDTVGRLARTSYPGANVVRHTFTPKTDFKEDRLVREG